MHQIWKQSRNKTNQITNRKKTPQAKTNQPKNPNNNSKTQTKLTTNTKEENLKGVKKYSESVS